jgi:hypothetical protein
MVETHAELRCIGIPEAKKKIYDADAETLVHPPTMGIR